VAKSANVKLLAARKKIKAEKQKKLRSAENIQLASGGGENLGGRPAGVKD